MGTLKLGRWGLAAAFVAGSAALFGAVQPAPGIVNFVEGQASIDGQAISGKSVGSVQLQKGDELQTSDGRVEVLLSPGVFLRVGQNSTIRMVAPDLLDTRVEVERGAALIEANQVHDESRIRVLNAGAQTTVLKKGLYRFDADLRTVAVYDGKAQVAADDRTVEVKGGREVNLNVPLAAQKFDKKASQASDQLFAWSKLRSDYLSQASAATAQTYIAGGWLGSGWYWNPWWHTYAWLPGDGVFYSPFGVGYYSPFAFSSGFYYAPRYYRGYVGPRVIRPRGPVGSAAPRISRGGGVGRSFGHGRGR